MFALRDKTSACLTALLVLLASFTGARAIEVKGIRFGVNPPLTRLVLDVSAETTFKAEVASDPWRLTVDLPRLDWRVAEHPQSRPKGLIGGYRYGQLDGQHSRVVLDATGPFRIDSRRVIEPDRPGGDWRLVLDLAPIEPVRAVAVPPPVPRPAVVARTAASSAIEPAAPPVVVAALPLPLPKPAAAPGMGADLPGPRRPVVVIDAGHGGVDPGAIGVGGVFEKTVTLAMAKALRKALEAGGRFKVVLTRDDDELIALRERIGRARRANGDLFVSLHADSIGIPQHRGASVYTLSEDASDAEAARLAAKENKADIIVGADLSEEDPQVASILIDLVQRDTNNRSIALADALVASLREVTPLVKRSRRYAGFVVLKAPDVPSVLVELGYLSNAKDARNLRDPAYRARLAEVIAAAIGRYFQQLEATL